MLYTAILVNDSTKTVQDAILEHALLNGTANLQLSANALQNSWIELLRIKASLRESIVRVREAVLDVFVILVEYHIAGLRNYFVNRERFQWFPGGHCLFWHDFRCFHQQAFEFLVQRLVFLLDQFGRRDHVLTAVRRRLKHFIYRIAQSFDMCSKFLYRKRFFLITRLIVVVLILVNIQIIRIVDFADGNFTVLLRLQEINFECLDLFDLFINGVNSIINLIVKPFHYFCLLLLLGIDGRSHAQNKIRQLLFLLFKVGLDQARHVTLQFLLLKK